MKLGVKQYLPPPHDYHRCVDEEGREHKVDLMIDGTLPEFQDNPEKLVGLTVETFGLTPYVTIAMEPRIVGP